MTEIKIKILESISKRENLDDREKDELNRNLVKYYLFKEFFEEK